MNSSRTISLFSEPTQANQKPSAYLVSAVAHVLVVGIVAYGFLFAPKIDMRAAAERYVVRRVDLDSPDPVLERMAGESILAPGRHFTRNLSSSHGHPAAPAASLLKLAKLAQADKSLVQPDTPPNPLQLKQNPLPALLLWSPQRPKVKLITPPPPRPAATPDLKPSIQQPNLETTLADVAISSTPFTTSAPMPLPSSTIPIAVQEPDQAQRIPETSSAASSLPTDATVLSLSDLQMKQGSIKLPSANLSGPGNPAGGLAPGRTGNASQPGSGNDPSSHATDPSRRKKNGAPGNSNGSYGSRDVTNSGNGKSNADPVSGGGGNQESEHPFTQISLPRNGQFGVVVVGSSMQEQFPETAGLWGGRLVYSVYLHVGLAQSWILQYSLPATADAMAAGNINRLDPPWPYYIVRPNVNAANVNADALMVHGFVDAAGRFENLSLVFPPGFAQAQLVLQGLQQWRFRPAKVNGRIARVEVLLIIPEDME